MSEEDECQFKTMRLMTCLQVTRRLEQLGKSVQRYWTAQWKRVNYVKHKPIHHDVYDMSDQINTRFDWNKDEIKRKVEQHFLTYRLLKSNRI